MESATAVCADCDARNPQWASINRGVFICDECNSIHRQLGRHVSHTKHLYKSLWRPSQLFMVQYLALAGANRFWEHVLLEPLLNKKPLPDSPLHPTKADFIRKKYLFHGFFKLPIVIHPDDLNQQLHASVRTAVLDTSLYLLALGADPNYIHPVKGTSPVHVACQYEQISQLELLIAYGGDVCLRSSKGISPLEVIFYLLIDKFVSFVFISVYSLKYLLIPGYLHSFFSYTLNCLPNSQTIPRVQQIHGIKQKFLCYSKLC
ncbi:unnamed protein product [Rodentolepis nana]|uniref:Arf-GAP domain-containing protein n=1 Tax=Rodentolepis nana TaxID=102285 RepID=A0A0R3TY02_RODNA|nr:unnamed protein product [Rodentolepis nana]